MKLPLIRGQQIKIDLADGALGGKIWPAALALCQYLEHHHPPSRQPFIDCIELGSGTGIVGIYAAATKRIPYYRQMILTEHKPPLESVMTSLPYSVDGSLEVDDDEENVRIQKKKSNRLLDLIQTNIDNNRHFFRQQDPDDDLLPPLPQVMELDWTQPNHAHGALKKLSTSSKGFPLILASDVTYVTQLHCELANTIAILLSKEGEESEVPPASKCFISHEERVLDWKGRDIQLQSFENALDEAGLYINKCIQHPVTMEEEVSVENSMRSSERHEVSILEIQHQHHHSVLN